MVMEPQPLLFIFLLTIFSSPPFQSLSVSMLISSIIYILYAYTPKYSHHNQKRLMYIIKLFCLLLLATNFIVNSQTSQILTLGGPSLSLQSSIPHCQMQNGNNCLKCQAGYQSKSQQCSLIEIKEAPCKCGDPFVEGRFNNSRENDVKTKSDGKYIYYLSREYFYVVDAYPAETAKMVSSLKINEDEFAQEFYYKDGILALITTKSEGIQRYGLVYYTTIRLYNFQNKNDIQLLYEYQIHGNYLSGYLTEDGFLRLVSEGRYSDPLNQPYWYSFADDLRKVENFFNFRRQPARLSGVIGTINGVNTTVMVVNMDNPIPNEVQVATFERDESLISEVKVTEDGVYFVNVLETEQTLILMAQIKRNQIIPTPINQTLDGILPQRNSVIYDKPSGMMLVLTTMSSQSKSFLYRFDANLEKVQETSEIFGRSIDMKVQFNTAYIRTFIQKAEFLVVYQMGINRLDYFQVTGSSEFFDIYQKDRIILYDYVRNVNDQTGIRISIVDISQYQMPRYSREYLFAEKSDFVWNRRGLLLSRNKNLFIVPSYEGNHNNGVTYFNIQRDQINLRGVKCYYECEDNNPFFLSILESSLQVQESLYIEEIIYHRSECQIIAVKGFNLSIVSKVQLC